MTAHLSPPSDPSIPMPASATTDRQQSGLALALRERTAPLHRQAERSGIVQEILRGTASRHGYALYLRSMLPAYQKMEQGLEQHRQMPGLRGIAEPDLYRSPAILRDLVALSGTDWAHELQLLPAAERYARRVALAAEGDGTGLIGHAYTRYLGDLSGAQVLKRSLMRSPGLQPGMLAFYDFPAIPNLSDFKNAFRHALDAAANEIPDVELVLIEAIWAFQHNIDISEAVQAVVTA